MSRLIPIGIFLMALWSCGHPLPKDVMPRDKMENVLFDMVRADEMTAQYALKDSAYRHMDKHTELYANIFQLHHTNQEEFKRSFRFYESHPEMMRTIIDTLQLRAEKWYNNKTENTKLNQ